ncbi:hypothetical protein ACJX0J_036888, partial [Zea mays]
KLTCICDLGVQRKKQYLLNNPKFIFLGIIQVVSIHINFEVNKYERPIREQARALGDWEEELSWKHEGVTFIPYQYYINKLSKKLKRLIILYGVYYFYLFVTNKKIFFSILTLEKGLYWL